MFKNDIKKIQIPYVDLPNIGFKSLQCGHSRSAFQNQPYPKLKPKILKMLMERTPEVLVRYSKATAKKNTICDSYKEYDIVLCKVFVLRAKDSPTEAETS